MRSSGRSTPRSAPRWPGCCGGSWRPSTRRRGRGEHGLTGRTGPPRRSGGRCRWTALSTTFLTMSDYDVIVIGAGHNGLTAAAVMARGGLRVLCLEKNHFIGGMASSTELIRGYHFELAGSIQFPVPNQIFEDLGFAPCPIYQP